MTSQDESTLQTSLPGLIALVVAAVGLIVARPPLDSARPVPAAVDGRRMRPHDGVPSRLWQDPLTGALTERPPTDGVEAILKARPTVIAGTGPQPAKKLLFLLECIDPADTSEAAELRRRERFAVLAALNTAGYVPAHPDRIYAANLGPASPTNNEKQGWPAIAKWPVAGATADQGTAARQLVRYEWTRRSTLQTRNADCSAPPAQSVRPHYDAVCVLWLSPSPDSERQLSRLAPLIKHLRTGLCDMADGADRHFAIAGRIGSTQLAAMMRENASLAVPVTLYVTNSTAPFVRQNPCMCTDLTVEYVIGTDKLLADELMDELDRRSISKQSGSLAILAEWDTDYGRSMHQVFHDAANCKGRDVGQYSFLRGLDGKALHRPAAGRKAPTTETSDSESGTDASETGANRAPTTTKPTAKEGEGDPQIDYVRRLAQRLQEDHKDTPLQAIGIVGNDVYDKLLLLRALRPRFPNAIFFTTDLDVRLLQPGDFDDTRNVLIASHYGLELSTNLQRAIAPFRSSYDTASYLGCLRAVKDDRLQCGKGLVDLRPWPTATDPTDGHDGAPCNPRFLVGAGQDRMPVHLYEVSRTGPYELTLREHDLINAPNPRLLRWRLDSRCWWLLGVVLIFGAILYAMSRPWQRLVYSVVKRGPAFYPVLGVVAALAFLAGLIYYAHTTDGEESFEWYEGVSVWPTILMRLLACVLCVYYAVRALHTLQKYDDKVHAMLGLSKANSARFWAGLTVAYRAWIADLRSAGTVKKLCRSMFAHGTSQRPLSRMVIFVAGGFWVSCAAWITDLRRAGTVMELCNSILTHGASQRRLFRMILLAGLNVLLFLLLSRLSDPVVNQARGWVAWVCYIVVQWLTLVTVAGLLMLVADSTLLAYRFVIALSGTAQDNTAWAQWPSELVAKEAGRRGLHLKQTGPDPANPESVATANAVSQWLTIHLTDTVTYALAARLIYYPFVVLLVLVVAQNPLFDNWHWTTPLAMMALFNAGVAVMCAVMLQRAARSARTRALDAMDVLVLARVGPTEDPFRAKLTQIRSDIENTNTGAFAGLSQNPVLAAVLIPLMGGGGLAALEQLLRHLSNP